MRKGFALLETLIALVVFSLLLMGGAKLLSTLYQERYIYQKSFQEGTRVQNIFFLLQNYFASSFFIHSPSSYTLSFYPLDLQAYYCSSFSPTAHFLTEKKLMLSYIPIHSTFLLSLPEQTLYPIASIYGKTLEFTQKVEGRYFLPLQGKFFLKFNHSTLYLNGQILLEEVKEFALKENQEWIEIKICLTQCYESSFKKGRIYEIL